jgi:hypothetical protein
MAIDLPSTAELDRCTKACTAFNSYEELKEKCTRQQDPYIPSLSDRKPEAVVVGKALEASGCRVYWMRKRS